MTELRYVASDAFDASDTFGTPAVRTGCTPVPCGPLRVSSQSLLAGRHEIEIEHDGAIYRLRRTSLGKLILTK